MRISGSKVLAPGTDRSRGRAAAAGLAAGQLHAHGSGKGLVELCLGRSFHGVNLRPVLAPKEHSATRVSPKGTRGRIFNQGAEEATKVGLGFCRVSNTLMKRGGR